MPHNRFFLDTPFHQDEIVSLQDEEAHHLKKVMRAQLGDSIELVNGAHQLALAKIEAFEKKQISLKVYEIQEKKPSSPLILCQAIPRLARLDLIVEKGTELGMTELRLFPGKLSEKKELTATQLKRLSMISIAAMKQCGRLDLPKITLYPPLKNWSVEDLLAHSYFGDVSNHAQKLNFLHLSGEEALIFIGPEAGFHQSEEEIFEQLGVKGVHLHSNILRTDTATFVALSLLSNH